VPELKEDRDGLAEAYVSWKNDLARVILALHHFHFYHPDGAVCRIPQLPVCHKKELFHILCKLEKRFG
jgi:hypothetical protein